MWTIFVPPRHLLQVSFQVLHRDKLSILRRQMYCRRRFLWNLIYPPVASQGKVPPISQRSPMTGKDLVFYMSGKPGVRWLIIVSEKSLISLYFIFTGLSIATIIPISNA